MLYEAYIRGPFGDWKSVGLYEGPADELIKLLPEPPGRSRLYISDVSLAGTLVCFNRRNNLSHALVERNECLFDSLAEAKVFADLVLKQLFMQPEYEGEE